LQMATHIRDLVAALVQRMQSAQIVGLKSSLLLIIDWYVPSILDASASVNSNYVNFLLPSRAMLKDIVK
jgi:hypothetical protein